MITVEKACVLAMAFTKSTAMIGAYRLFDMMESYVVVLQNKRHDLSLMPVSVDKHTGECSTFYLDMKHLEMMEKSRMIEVPKECKI